MTKQSLRSFVEQYKQAYPKNVIYVKEPVNQEFDIQSILLELERCKQYPILIFEKVGRSKIPVVTNVYANRQAFALALGVDIENLPSTYSQRLSERIEPNVTNDPPFRKNVFKGKDIKLSMLPILTHFPGDAGPYITAGMLVAKEPNTGVYTLGYHRLQVKGNDKLGVSLHSRRRMFEYQRRAAEQGKNLECAIVIGLHPLIGMGALSYPPNDVSKYEIIGGLFQSSMDIASCETIKLMVPAWGEIIIEGEILAEARESEGPFGEFTGYSSSRSTENIFSVKAICMQDNPWYQSIGPGRLSDHVLPLAIMREAEILKALSRTIPNVQAVHVPPSGGGSFIAYVSIKKTRYGEAKHMIPIIMGVDHYLKLVVIVDEDVDVFDESEVMWAIATRAQPDTDFHIMSGMMGAILDPSATKKGLTSKVGIDATKPLGENFANKLDQDTQKADWARDFIGRII